MLGKHNDVVVDRVASNVSNSNSDMVRVAGEDKCLARTSKECCKRFEVFHLQQ